MPDPSLISIQDLLIPRSISQPVRDIIQKIPFRKRTHPSHPIQSREASGRARVPKPQAVNTAVLPEDRGKAAAEESRQRRLGWEPWTGEGGGQAAGARPSSVFSLRHQEDRVMGKQVLPLS